MRRAVIYSRKSVFKGLDQKYNSLEAQEDMAKSFIHSHTAEGWIYLRTYSDAGLSGSNTNRPALQELLAAARRKEFEMLVVFKLDRLARNQRDFLNLLDELAQNGVEVASVSEQQREYKEQGKILFHEESFPDRDTIRGNLLNLL